jgi:hypothetical protein
MQIDLAPNPANATINVLREIPFVFVSMWPVVLSVELTQTTELTFICSFSIRLGFHFKKPNNCG